MPQAVASRPRALRTWSGALVPWAAALLALAAQLAGPEWAVGTGLAMFAAGLAHGAGDEQDGALRPFSAIHAAAYVLVGLAVAGLFLAAPLAGVAVFFALSAWHFARSECGVARLPRYAIAGLAVGGSALFRPAETAAVLMAVTGEAVPGLFMAILAAAGIAGAAFAAAAIVRADRGAGLALLSVGAVAILHPVLAVGLVFLVAHALPILQRQMAHYGSGEVLRAAALPTGLALLGGAALLAAWLAGAIPLGLVAALAFGMATPHMLTERLER